MKHQKNKKQNRRLNNNIIVWLAILMLVVFQGISLWQIISLKESANHYSDLPMRYLLKDTEERRYQHPVIDVSENRVYIPEVRIYLPLNEASRNMRYEYKDHGAGNWSKALYLSSSSVVGQQTGAQYGTCDRMVILAPNDNIHTTQDDPVGTIAPVQDGLSSIYAHSDSDCWDGDWYKELRDNIVEVVKEAKSY